MPADLHERTGTEFNFLEMPPGIVFWVVLFRLLFKLSLRIPLRSLEVRIWWGKKLCRSHPRTRFRAAGTREVILTAVRRYLRYSLAHEHVSDLLAERGLHVDTSCLRR
jgi:hypothetical protein